MDDYKELIIEKLYNMLTDIDYIDFLTEFTNNLNGNNLQDTSIKILRGHTLDLLDSLGIYLESDISNELLYTIGRTVLLLESYISIDESFEILDSVDELDFEDRLYRFLILNTNSEITEDDFYSNVSEVTVDCMDLIRTNLTKVTLLQFKPIEVDDIKSRAIEFKSLLNNNSALIYFTIIELEEYIDLETLFNKSYIDALDLDRVEAENVYVYLSKVFDINLALVQVRLGENYE